MRNGTDYPLFSLVSSMLWLNVLCGFQVLSYVDWGIYRFNWWLTDLARQFSARRYHQCFCHFSAVQSQKWYRGQQVIHKSHFKPLLIIPLEVQWIKQIKLGSRCIYPPSQWWLLNSETCIYSDLKRDLVCYFVGVV